MLGVLGYQTKKELKQQIGKPLAYVETSFFGEEYKDNGILTVVGPDAYRNRKWYATVKLQDGKIVSVL